MPLHTALFLSRALAGAKYALSLLGRMERRCAPAAGARVDGSDAGRDPCGHGAMPA